MAAQALIDEATGSGILDGISKGLDAIGPNVEQVFYTEMMYSHNLTKNEILDRPEEFTEALSQFFRVGTSLVNRAIGQQIVKNFGLPVSPGLTFKAALELVMKLPAASPTKKTGEYDPHFCKTCQKLGRASPTVARVPFSDCQEHFTKRVANLKRTVRFEGNLRFNPLIG
ncbi:MAG TPA: hypothetical protein VED17_06715 [Nitrososphaerales archaeon]|nr:hypothetical protein [Nitrososphaerales archaeon]